jgi:DNA-binding response OmpR family regulator
MSFEVKTTSSVAAAKALVGTESFDLIVADYSLEDGNVESLYFWLGVEHPELVNKFILITGWPYLEGFPIILQKPFHLRELEEVVKQVLGD